MSKLGRESRKKVDKYCPVVKYVCVPLQEMARALELGHVEESSANARKDVLMVLTIAAQEGGRSRNV